MVSGKRMLAGAAIASVLGCGGVAEADVVKLTEWVVYGQPGSQETTAASGNAVHVTGLDLSRHELNASGANHSFSTSGWTSESYVSFGFTVADGYAADLDTLVLGTRSSNTGPGFIGLYYSGDDFASPLFTLEQPGGGFVNEIIDLGSLTGLTGTVEFRLKMIGDTAANGGTVSSGGTWRIGDYYEEGVYTPAHFTGTVAVPEPASVALLGTGGLLLLVKPRRTRA